MNRVAFLPTSPGAPLMAQLWCSSHILPVMLAAGAFGIDLFTPNGVVDGLLYICAVLSCFWVPSANAALYTAGGVSPAMIVGFILSPSGAAMQIALINRCAALGVVWLAAYGVWRFGREQKSAIVTLAHALRATDAAARAERVVLSDWLHREIGPELEVLAWRLKYLPCRRRQLGFDLDGEALLLQRAIQRARQAAWDQETRLRGVVQL